VRRQVLFIQGGGESAHDEWDNKLVESLGRELGADYEIRYPPVVTISSTTTCQKSLRMSGALRDG
jgi:hypothetical protein